MKPEGAPTERQLLKSIRLATARRTPHLLLGIGDDCAILRPPSGHDVLVTTDFSLEQRHFRRDWHSADSAGHRCLARGLSDVAAMGAKPLSAFLSLALPDDLPKSWVQNFFEGMMRLADRYHVPLAGGDTAESPSALVLADIMVIASAPRGKALCRSGARSGDRLYVTGALGGAAAELNGMSTGRGVTVRMGGWQEHPHMFPEPRLACGELLLRRRLASACIDLSDGLSTDLGHLCDESHLTAEVNQGAVPIHPIAMILSPPERGRLALHGGEDYELLFTASPGTRVPRSLAGVAITEIGRMLPASTERPLISLVDASGAISRLEGGGWEHFSKR